MLYVLFEWHVVMNSGIYYSLLESFFTNVFFLLLQSLPGTWKVLLPQLTIIIFIICIIVPFFFFFCIDKPYCYILSLLNILCCMVIYCYFSIIFFNYLALLSFIILAAALHYCIIAIMIMLSFYFYFFTITKEGRLVCTWSQSLFTPYYFFSLFLFLYTLLLCDDCYNILVLVLRV